MKPKTITTAILLLFVAASVIYLVVGELRQEQTTAEVSGQEQVDTQQAQAQQTPADGADAGVSGKPVAADRKVIAYYFFGNVRCVTCKTIEAYTEETLKSTFPEELKTGKLEWRPLNMMLPENEHFVSDYKLMTRSVVLAEVIDGRQTKWNNLTRVWELVRNKPAFVAYIQEETKSYLKD
ncbi:MAG: hypothetical protein HY801_03775 [Candidatus Lindowbacteria bacterium]|nr:hypothetical protein [Candidatus Lindowbacteria bacterium]